MKTQTDMITIDKYNESIVKFNAMMNDILNDSDNYNEEDYFRFNVINKYALNIMKLYKEYILEDEYTSFEMKYERLLSILTIKNNLNVLTL
jgi:hypothetical protein